MCAYVCIFEDRIKNCAEIIQIETTAGLPIRYPPTNNQFANEPEGLRHFRDHRWKALGEENPILSGLFLFRHYFESYSV